MFGGFSIRCLREASFDVGELGESAGLSRALSSLGLSVSFVLWLSSPASSFSSMGLFFRFKLLKPETSSFILSKWNELGDDVCLKGDEHSVSAFRPTTAKSMAECDLCFIKRLSRFVSAECRLCWWCSPLLRPSVVWLRYASNNDELLVLLCCEGDTGLGMFGIRKGDIGLAAVWLVGLKADCCGLGCCGWPW